MIRIEADTTVVDGQQMSTVQATLSYDVASPSQFEDEAEAVLWNVIKFMADHSELNEREIILSLLADLEDAGEPPFSTTVCEEE